MHNAVPARNAVTEELQKVEAEIKREVSGHTRPQTIAAAVIGSLILAAIVGGVGWLLARRFGCCGHWTFGTHRSQPRARGHDAMLFANGANVI